MHATVKEALALSQVGPSAEMPPPDPTGAEPGRESADFQMRRRRRCLCDIGTKSRGLSELFLNGMAAQEAPSAPVGREQDPAPELPEETSKKRKRRSGGQKSGAARQYDARGKHKDNTGGNHLRSLAALAPLRAVLALLE